MVSFWWFLLLRSLAFLRHKMMLGSLCRGWQCGEAVLGGLACMHCTLLVVWALNFRHAYCCCIMGGNSLNPVWPGECRWREIRACIWSRSVKWTDSLVCCYGFNMFENAADGYHITWRFESWDRNPYIFSYGTHAKNLAIMLGLSFSLISTPILQLSEWCRKKGRGGRERAAEVKTFQESLSG